MKQHIHYNDKGEIIDNKIRVKYYWYTDPENKKTMCIAYLRNFRNGVTLYGASTMKHNNATKKDTKTYHRYIATDRLYYYPMTVTTKINVHQSIVENELKNFVEEFGCCDRYCSGWDADSEFIFNKAVFVDIRNPFTTKDETIQGVRNKILSALPSNAQYILFKTKGREMVCVYTVISNDENNTNTVKYGGSIYKLVNCNYMTRRQKLFHINTAIQRFINKPVVVDIIAENKKSLHNMLKKMLQGKGVKSSNKPLSGQHFVNKKKEIDNISTIAIEDNDYQEGVLTPSPKLTMSAFQMHASFDNVDDAESETTTTKTNLESAGPRRSQRIKNQQMKQMEIS